MMKQNDDAVSPVVGVMLMLVVTIIIAAVVSAFAGGMGSGTTGAPVVTIAAIPYIESIQDTDTSDYGFDYPAGFSADNGLVFEHKGGDPFSLNEIEVQLQYVDAKIKIGLDDTMPVSRCTTSLVYLEEIGSSDGLIQAGDKFMLYSDNCGEDPLGKKISWAPDGSSKSFSLYMNKKATYKIIDKASGKPIQQGDFVLNS